MQRQRPIGVFSNSPARMRNSAEIDTRAVAIFVTAVLHTYAKPVCLPFSLLRHYDMSHSFRTFLLLFSLLKESTERVDESDIKAPTAASG